MRRSAILVSSRQRASRRIRERVALYPERGRFSGRAEGSAPPRAALSDGKSRDDPRSVTKRLPDRLPPSVDPFREAGPRSPSYRNRRGPASRPAGVRFFGTTTSPCTRGRPWCRCAVAHLAAKAEALSALRAGGTLANPAVDRGNRDSAPNRPPGS